MSDFEVVEDGSVPVRALTPRGKWNPVIDEVSKGKTVKIPAANESVRNSIIAQGLRRGVTVATRQVDGFLYVMPKEKNS